MDEKLKSQLRETFFDSLKKGELDNKVCLIPAKMLHALIGQSLERIEIAEQEGNEERQIHMTGCASSLLALFQTAYHSELMVDIDRKILQQLGHGADVAKIIREAAGDPDE